MKRRLAAILAVDVVGYYYKQVTGDSGSGAALGDFKGESFGVGPGFIWFPKFSAGKMVVLGKWIHDFDATNRFESDYGTLTVAWTF
ncbi:MAG: transporter [Alphaproteobacteria bacterium]